MDPPSPQPRLPALLHREFRLLWVGQLFTTLGKRMLTAIILWHIYDLTADPLALGLVGLVNFAPIIPVSLVSGVLADTMDRRRLMLVTQITMVVLTACLAWFSLQNLDSVWLVYALSFLSTVGWTFETPARHALIPAVVPRADLANAYSLVSAVLQVGSIIGPAIAGVVIARLDIGVAYGLNVMPFLAAGIALLFMRNSGFSAVTQKVEKPTMSLGAVLEGLRFVLSHPIIRPVMLLDFFATFFSSAVVLLPVFAQDVLEVGAEGYGWLYTAVSLGAVLTATLMSLRREIQNQGLLLLWAVAIYGLATILFGLSRSFWLSMIALALTGAADTLSTIIRQTIRNLQTPDLLRGRMTSMNMIFYRGGPELGELEAGLAATLLGAPGAVILGGTGCLLALAVISWRSPLLRTFQPGDGDLGSVPVG